MLIKFKKEWLGLYVLVLLSLSHLFGANGVWHLPVTINPVNASHDFHISKTRLEYAAIQQEWQLSLHLFIDDLEVALTTGTAHKLFLGTEREDPIADSLIAEYLKEKLDFTVDGQALHWEWLGKETSEDLSALWVYLYIPKAAIPQQATISNRILLDLYDDQQNIVQLIGPRGSNKHLLFHRDHKQEKIQF